MGLLDLSARISLLIDEIRSNTEQDLLIVSNDLFALIRTRIQQQRLDSEGNTFGTYSKAVVPRWYGYATAQSNAAVETIKKGGYFQSYEDFRKADGLQVESLDFSRTGQMFQQSDVIDTSANGDLFTVSIGGKTEYARTLLDYHGRRFGNLFTPSQTELDMVSNAIAQRIFGKIINIL